MSLEAVHSSRRAPVNLIDAAMLAITNRAKPLLPSVFQQPSSALSLVDSSFEGDIPPQRLTRRIVTKLVIHGYSLLKN